jgi:hypothetical protein
VLEGGSCGFGHLNEWILLRNLPLLQLIAIWSALRGSKKQGLRNREVRTIRPGVQLL